MERHVTNAKARPNNKLASSIRSLVLYCLRLLMELLWLCQGQPLLDDSISDTLRPPTTPFCSSDALHASIHIPSKPSHTGSTASFLCLLTSWFHRSSFYHRQHQCNSLLSKQSTRTKRGPLPPRLHQQPSPQQSATARPPSVRRSGSCCTSSSSGASAPGRCGTCATRDEKRAGW